MEAENIYLSTNTAFCIYSPPVMDKSSVFFSAIDFNLFSYLWPSLNCKFRKSVILSGSLSHRDPRDGRSVQIHSGLLRRTVLSTDVMSRLTVKTLSCLTTIDVSLLETFWCFIKFHNTILNLVCF